MISFSRLQAKLSFFTSFLVTAIQEMVAVAGSKETGLRFYHHCIDRFLLRLESPSEREEAQSSYCYTLLKLHYQEVVSLLTNPLAPISHLFIQVLNSLFVRRLPSHPSRLVRLVVELWPDLIVHLTTLHNQTVANGFDLTGVVVRSPEEMESIVASWVHDAYAEGRQSSEQATSLQSYSVLQQLLLNSASLASYTHHTAPWNAIQAVLRSQWLQKSSAGERKRVRTNSFPPKEKPPLEDLLRLPVCPRGALWWCYRSYTGLCPLVASLSRILTMLLSLFPSSSIRQKSSILTALQRVILCSPQLLVQPAVLRVLTSSLSSSHATLVERVLSLLTVAPSVLISQPLLVRTAVAVGLKQASRSVRVQTMQMVQSCENVLLASPMDDDAATLLKHLSQQTLKHLVLETDEVVTRHTQKAALLLWTHPHLHLPTLQHLVEVVDDCVDSLVVTDSALRSSLVTTLSLPEARESVCALLHAALGRLANDPTPLDLHLLLVLLDTPYAPLSECVSLLPSLLHSPDCLPLALRLLSRVLCGDSSLSCQEADSLHRTVLSLLPEVDTVKLIQETSRCLLQVILLGQSLDLPFIESLRSCMRRCVECVKSYVECVKSYVECVKNFANSVKGCANSNHEREDPLQRDEKEVLRSVLVLGQLCQHMDRRLYASLVEDDTSLRVSSIASALSSLFFHSESSHPIHLYALESYFRCLLHSPDGIASEMVQQTVEVVFLTGMNGRFSATASLNPVALFSSCSSWFYNHSPRCVRRGNSCQLQPRSRRSLWVRSLTLGHERRMGLLRGLRLASQYRSSREVRRRGILLQLQRHDPGVGSLLPLQRAPSGNPLRNGLHPAGDPSPPLQGADGKDN